MATHLLGLFFQSIKHYYTGCVRPCPNFNIFQKYGIGWCGARGICDRVMDFLNSQFVSDHSTVLLPSKQQRILKKNKNSSVLGL